MALKKVNLKEKFSTFTAHWTPKIVGELNQQHVKIAKVKGDFVMHHHENEDELFFVVKGCLKIALKDQTIVLDEGEFIVIPKGVEHKPYAEEEAHILLFEPATTLNTGNAINELTVDKLDTI